MGKRRQVGELPRVFRGVDAVRAGALSPSQLRGPEVQRVLHGIYCPGRVPVSHEVRCEGAGLVLPEDAQLTGTSMATVLGVELARPADLVQVVLPDRSRQERFRGIEFRRVTVPLEPGRSWRTCTLATPGRMAFDLAARVDLPEAVARLDAVARARLVDRADLESWMKGRTDNNLCAVRAAVALMDPRAESSPESKCRVHLALAGLDVTPQHSIYIGNELIARVDLAVVEQKVAIEYDGAWHALREQLEQDRRRLNALRDAGWVVVHVTAGLLRRPRELVDTVRRAVLLRSI